MRMSKMIAAVAALALTASPALAVSANPAAGLSLSKSVRAGTSAKRASKLADGPTAITALFLGGLVVAGVTVAIINSGDDDDADSN